MATPTYRYLLTDLLTDRVVASLPLRGVTFDRRISRTGSLQGNMEVPGANGVRVAKLLEDYAGRAALWVYRDRSVWWGGVLWIAIPAQGKRGAVKVDVTAATFDSYAFHRRLYSDVTYTGEDQGVVIADLWRQLQADARGNIGVQAVDQLVGSPTVDLTYKASDQAFVGDVIQQIGDADLGPEHTIDVYSTSAGQRVKRLRVARTLGLREPLHVFSRAAGGGGNVTDWSHANDATGGGTTFQTRGDGLVSDTVYRDDLLDAGWPLLDVTEDFGGVKHVGVLNRHAQSMSTTRGGAARVSSYTVEVGATGWNPNNVGDAVRLRLFDDYHQGDDLVVRPVACSVTAADRSTPETVNLILTEDE